MTSVLAVALLMAPAALATTQTAHSGIVSATFSFTGSYPKLSGETLTIERSGTVFYQRPVTSSLCGSFPCAPASTSQPSVSVRDLQGDGQPDVVLALYSGGANCCFVDEVFSWDPGTMTYVEAQRDLGYAGARIEDLAHDGKLEFLTADSAFVGEFTDVAASAEPIEILSFADGRFHDVTRAYPKLIAADAARDLKAFEAMAPHYADSVGVIAAWAADEDLLGHRSLVSSYLGRQAADGHLNSALSGLGAPGGAKFVAALQTFLRKHGYRS